MVGTGGSDEEGGGSETNNQLGEWARAWTARGAAEKREGSRAVSSRKRNVCRWAAERGGARVTPVRGHRSHALRRSAATAAWRDLLNKIPSFLGKSREFFLSLEIGALIRGLLDLGIDTEIDPKISRDIFLKRSL